MRWRLRRSADMADLAHAHAELERERAHSRSLARSLAEAHETNRHLIESSDWWKGECRRHVATIVNLKAQQRTSAT